MVMLAVCTAGAVFAQNPQKQEPVKKTLERVDLLVPEKIFDEAYTQYMDLMNEDNVPAMRKRYALLRMSRAYMQLSPDSRIKTYAGYFAGQWKFRDQEPLNPMELLADQAEWLGQGEQEAYAAFLEQLDRDIAAYNRAHRPARNGVLRMEK